MAALTVQTIKGPHPSSVAANSLDITLTASTPAGDTFASTGREILLVQNSDSGTQTFTVTSQPDSFNRTTTILTTYSMAAGEFAAFWFGQVTGWRDSSGNVNLLSSDATIKYAVLRLPL